MGNEKLTTLARRLRPFISSQISSLISGGAVSAGADINVLATRAGTEVSRAGDSILRFATGSVIKEYAATSAGFDLALAEAAAGDTIWIPSMTISGNHTIPAGVEVIGEGNYTSVLSGVITNNGIISGLRLSGTLTNNGTLHYVIDPAGNTQSTLDLGIRIEPRVDIHADALGENVTMRCSAELGYDASIQLYARNGTAYSGWAIVRNQTDRTLKINWDDTEGIETKNVIQMWNNHIDPKVDVIMPNNIALRWYDSGGIARNVLAYDNVNNIIIGVDGDDAKVYIERLDTSTALAPLQDSRPFVLMANYWNGASQAQRPVQFINNMTASGATPANQLDISLGNDGAEQLIMSLANNNGTLLTTINSAIDLPEISAPASPAVNTARLYAKDNGSGTTYLYYKRSDGTEVQIAAAVTPALNDLTDVDTTGVGVGDIIYKTAGDWVDYPLGVGTDIANAGGSIKIGNVAAGNYMQIDTTTGEVALAGTATAWDDIQPYYIVGAGPNEAGTAQYGTTGFYWVKFTDTHAKDEEKQYGFQIPHRWKQASDVHFHLHIVPSANGAAGNEDVVFRISYQWVNINGSYSTTTNSTDTQTFRVGAAEGNKHILWEFPALAGFGKTLSSDLVIRLERMSKTSSATDNYTGDIWLRYVDLHVEIDSFGSFDETTKVMTSNLLLETGDALLLETGDKVLLE